MALAKKTLFIVIVCVVVLIIGIGCGLYVIPKFFRSAETSTEVQIPDPGPMIDLGQFTSTLADPEVHVVKLKVMLELSGQNVTLRLVDPGWIVKLKDETLKTLKDQRYDNIRYAEGMEKLKQDLKARLNVILPRVDGNAAIDRVFFDEFLVQ
ncbi:MAG: flagellar basal body-associated FliL family protein [Synergistaceae bacterium]|jgi:flagellar FliL protein|nr:flagellar basal body-associated FliL family protein [Synergistaceae bacterium]